MSYFDTIYADHLLPHRARTVYMYLRDRAMPSKNAGPASRPLRQTCTSPAARSSGRWMSWSSTVIWSVCRATALTAAAPPISIQYDKNRHSR